MSRRIDHGCNNREKVVPIASRHISYSMLAINHGRIFMQRRVWCDRPLMPRTGSVCRAQVPSERFLSVAGQVVLSDGCSSQVSRIDRFPDSDAACSGSGFCGDRWGDSTSMTGADGDAGPGVRPDGGWMWRCRSLARGGTTWSRSLRRCRRGGSCFYMPTRRSSCGEVPGRGTGADLWRAGGASGALRRPAHLDPR